MLTLLTDLIGNWVFLYYGSCKKWHEVTTTNASTAIFLLENILNSSDPEEFPFEFVNRLSLDDFLRPLQDISDNGNKEGDQEDSKEGEGGSGNENDSNFGRMPPTSAQNISGGSKRDDAAKGGGNAGGTAMLQFGGDVANELDLLDFIDDEEERTEIKIRYLLQHVVPLIKFPDCADENETSSSSLSSSASQTQEGMEKDDTNEYISSCTEINDLALSEHNLLRHNKAVRGNAGKINF